MVFRRLSFLIAAMVLLGVGAVFAAVPSPPPPAEYKAHIRYRIRAGRNERLKQYFALLNYLQGLGFQKEDGADNEPEDPDHVMLTGKIPSVNVRKVLLDTHVRGLVLIPANYTLPADPNALVKVQLEIAGGLPADRQALLIQQLRPYLAQAGFLETIGFDTRQNTRMVGLIPAGKLADLVEDQRMHTTGWLAPEVSVKDLPQPLAQAWPVRVVEVIPEPADAPPLKPFAIPPVPPQGQEYLLKITPELLALMNDADKKSQPTRMEVILAAEPTAREVLWIRELARADSGVVVEGHVGPLVTVLGRPEQAAAVSALPRVSTVRLPRSGQPRAVDGVAAPGEAKAALEASGLERLQKQGHKGKGIRVAIVDGDFAGYERYLGKGLPKGTKLIDLTAERNVDLRPEPMPTDTAKTGHGTQCALAASLAAPEAELTLIRVDPAAPHMLHEVARYLNGDLIRTESLDQRSDELLDDAERLANEKEVLLRERAAVLDNFATDKATTDQREAHFKKWADWQTREQALQGRRVRFAKLLNDLQGLKGIRAVASSLVWNEGLPADGSGALSRYFDDRPYKAALWFQSVGNTRGQAWNGLFRDTDGNGVMEFAGPDMPLHKGQWTNELNFLAWQPPKGSANPDLPAKTTARISFQWREPHDPEFLQHGEDAYQSPLAFIRLVVLRQRDPSGKTLPADDMDLIAVSPPLPQRLENRPDSATYEQTVEFTVETAGRYALRVEGYVPPGIRPPSARTLPILTKTWELRPRIFAATLGEAAPGRVVFGDYTTELGSMGTPADARRVLSVGAAELNGKAQPYSAGGPPMNLDLLKKPNLLAVDALGLAGPAFGASLAASFAAGLAADVLSARDLDRQILLPLRIQPGAFLRVPSDWQKDGGR